MPGPVLDIPLKDGDDRLASNQNRPRAKQKNSEFRHIVEAMLQQEQEGLNEYHQKGREDDPAKTALQLVKPTVLLVAEKSHQAPNAEAEGRQVNQCKENVVDQFTEGSSGRSRIQR